MKLKRPPDFIIGNPAQPYMLRWYILPRNNWLNVYLHKFMRDDDDRAMHDHPWWFLSVMLNGRYLEHRGIRRAMCRYFRWPCTCDKPQSRDVVSVWRTAPSIAFRTATARHRVELDKNATGESIPCWTLVITGRKVRTWGFWCPKGFVPWHEFVDSTNHGNVGKGCE